MYQVYLRDTIKIIDFATMILEFLVDFCVRAFWSNHTR